MARLSIQKKFCSKKAYSNNNKKKGRSLRFLQLKMLQAFFYLPPMNFDIFPCQRLIFFYNEIVHKI